jgi:hypothetical protein
MFGGNGKRRAGPDNDRLRAENTLLEGRLAWYRGRLRVISAQNRTLRARAEIADGHLAAAVQKHRTELKRVADELAELKRRTDDTVEVPIPAAADLAVA